jgi:hypothetical protein
MPTQGWHPDERVELAMIRFLDELCTWERNTGRGGTVVVIPYASDEPLLIAQNGKLLDQRYLKRIDQEEALLLVKNALTKRGG